MWNKPDDCPTGEIHQMYDDGAPVNAETIFHVPAEPGPLTRLFRGLGIDDKLPPIPTLKPIDVMPFKVGTPVSKTTAVEDICPTCTIFEIEPGTELCPRCNRRAGIRAVELDKQRQHDACVRQELAERRLTEIAPDWRERFTDWEAAELFYSKNDAQPTRPTRTIYTSGAREEPDDYASRPDPEPDDGNDFDTDLEPHNER